MNRLLLRSELTRDEGKGFVSTSVQVVNLPLVSVGTLKITAFPKTNPT